MSTHLVGAMAGRGLGLAGGSTAGRDLLGRHVD